MEKSDDELDFLPSARTGLDATEVINQLAWRYQSGRIGFIADDPHITSASGVKLPTWEVISRKLEEHTLAIETANYTKPSLTLRFKSIPAEGDNPFYPWTILLCQEGRTMADTSALVIIGIEQKDLIPSSATETEEQVNWAYVSDLPKEVE